jgi:hypothetical protein
MMPEFTQFFKRFLSGGFLPLTTSALFIMKYTDATPQEIDTAMQESWIAFHAYRKLSLTQRDGFMRAIETEVGTSVYL